jgi:hypothetical protein
VRVLNARPVAVNECICLLTLSMIYCKGIVKLWSPRPRSSSERNYQMQNKLGGSPADLQLTHDTLKSVPYKTMIVPYPIHFFLPKSLVSRSCMSKIPQTILRQCFMSNVWLSKMAGHDIDVVKHQIKRQHQSYNCKISRWWQAKSPKSTHSLSRKGPLTY